MENNFFNVFCLIITLSAILAGRVLANSDMLKNDLSAETKIVRDKQTREFVNKEIGVPLPIRSMYVKDGVLLYEDGKEVALWGVNYLPMSWHQYVNMKKLGADMKKAIDIDISHLKQMSVDIIRVHIFDREISNGAGDIVSTDSLDLLEYLIASCKKNEIYVFITLLSWWGSPISTPDCFSSKYTKMALLYDDEAIKIQKNYIKQLINRKNKYSGIAMKDDKNICIFELFNEPWYWNYSDFTSDITEDYRLDQTAKQIYMRNREDARKLWIDWCADNSKEQSQQSFDLFRYKYVRKYIDEMVSLLREEGVKQPIGWSPFLVTANSDAGVDIKDSPIDICAAIADSKADFFTVSDYLGGFGYRDNRNNMDWLKDFKLTALLDGKAAVLYEFDATGTYTSAYLYPGMAKKFRNFGAQIACQFQYDSIITAAYNTDWVTHYLNLFYTPHKTASFMIAGEAFKSIPRGKSFPYDDNEILFDDFAISYTNNISIMSGKGKLYHSAPVDKYMPFDSRSSPKEILGVGNSQYVRYAGTGIYRLKKGVGSYTLIVNPDAIQLYNCMDPMTSSFDRKTVDLLYDSRKIEINIPGFHNIMVVKIESDGKKIPIDVTGTAFNVVPGKYIIRKSK